MSQNIYDLANQLERELRQSKEYTALVDAFAAINSNEESKQLFTEFRQVSAKFQQLQMEGKEPSQKDLKEANDLSIKAQESKEISALIQAEHTLSIVMNDLNKIITKPLEDIYTN